MSVIPFSKIIGQERAVRFLRKVLSGRKMPHAYLFSGPEGVGRTTTALALASAVNCLDAGEREACGRCLPCRQMLNGSFADLLVLSPEGESLGARRPCTRTFLRQFLVPSPKNESKSQSIRIEQIRELERRIAFKPVSGKYRVTLVRPAEALTEEAANGFLKTLEEPPEGNILIVIAREPRDLLPTIVSRCQKVSFRPIPVDLIVSWLKEQKGLDESKAIPLARVSEGSLGKAVLLSEGDYLEKRKEHLQRVMQLPALSAVESLELALGYVGEMKGRASGGAERAELVEMTRSGLLFAWKSWFRDLLLMKAGCAEDSLVNFEFLVELKNASKGLSMEDLMQGLQILELAERDLILFRNLDLVLENAVLSLKRLTGGKGRSIGRVP